MAYFIRTHEKALANALQLKRQGGKHGHTTSTSGDASPTQISSFQNTTNAATTTSGLAAAFSLGSLSFSSHSIKPAKLTLTPHHLFYLLSRFEELEILVGPMNVRLESIHAETQPGNYVSFLSQSQRTNRRSDRDSIHSVSSVHSVMSTVSNLWSNLGMGGGSSTAKTEKAKAQLQFDIKYLYSAFTKIPCLRLSPDRNAYLIRGYEEFPFDSAVPLLVFKNVTALEICDLDFRQFFGWDKLAENLRSLSLKCANVEDPTDLLVGVVLDDIEKRRRRSSKTLSSSNMAWPPSPSPNKVIDFFRPSSVPGSPTNDDGPLGKSASPRNNAHLRSEYDAPRSHRHNRTKSSSPTRPSSSRQGSSYRHVKRASSGKIHRSGSGSSTSSIHSIDTNRNRSSPNLSSMSVLPSTKWRFLKHLGLADNSLTSLPTSSLLPLSDMLHSIDLSSNLFTEVPDCLASLSSLRALNLSNCMILTLHSLKRNPLPAISVLNLRGNRLSSIAGIERLLSLERLDLRDNKIADPTEIARLTGTPDIREIYVLGNPFIKSHSTYRVTILNLFRDTPGYTEDIIIDSLGPGYNERRQLRERATEDNGVPVVKPLPVEWDTAQRTPQQKEQDVYSRGDLDHALGIYRRPAPQTVQSEFSVNPSRRKKGVRRKIVDLADDGSPIKTTAPVNALTRKPQVAFADFSLSPGDSPSPLNRKEQPRTPQEDDGITSPTLTSTSTPALETSPFTPTSLSITNDLEHINLNGEAYRRKVEGLKEEYGNGWLNVLNDEAWRNQHSRKPHQSSPEVTRIISPERPVLTDLRATSQGIVSGGRTFG